MAVATLALTTALLVQAPAVAASLSRPTPVVLDFKDRTLEQVVDAIDRAGPNRIVVAPPPKPEDFFGGIPQPRAETPPPRFDFHEPKPVPFWAAVDRLCRESKRRPVIARSPEPRVVLVRASGDRGFVCNDGAFRVMVAGLSYGRGAWFAPDLFEGPGEKHTTPPPAHRDKREYMQVELAIMPEPRLRVDRLVSLTVLEAVDDRGRSLIAADPQREPGGSFKETTLPARGAFDLPLALRYPEDPGTMITWLKGVVSLEVGEGARPGHTRAEVRFEFRDVPMP